MKAKKKIHGYKFTIYDRLRKMSIEDVEIAWLFLPEKLNITRGTFRNWIYTKLDDKLEISGNAILILATFFECEPIEMYEEAFFDPIELKEDWHKCLSINKEIEESTKTYYDAI